MPAGTSHGLVCAYRASRSTRRSESHILVSHDGSARAPRDPHAVCTEGVTEVGSRGSKKVREAATGTLIEQELHTRVGRALRIGGWDLLVAFQPRPIRRRRE